ncbi:hypothetical protein EZS27_021988 [termite gut metagenome]|uniref:Uncharacterized protein n=1 Tax=termite gut metagenome TaxID=433724 RepID=A0A5J4R7U0_9ZZZZ
MEDTSNEVESGKWNVESYLLRSKSLLPFYQCTVGDTKIRF